jgi:methylated-DNA-[protein]-cysteine S-methyltransferase
MILHDSSSDHAHERYSYCASPLGDLLMTCDGEALTGIYLPEHNSTAGQHPQPGWVRDDSAFRAARDQLRAYFAGELLHFEILLRMKGTAFQRRAWEELIQIPFGETISYAEQAGRMGRPGAARAVGAANGRNPICIVVPCHRVIGADGTLTGYGGGLDRKEWLLCHEASVLGTVREHGPRHRKVAVCLAGE